MLECYKISPSRLPYAGLESRGQEELLEEAKPRQVTFRRVWILKIRLLRSPRSQLWFRACANYYASLSHALALRCPVPDLF